MKTRDKFVSTSANIRSQILCHFRDCSIPEHYLIKFSQPSVSLSDCTITKALRLFNCLRSSVVKAVRLLRKLLDTMGFAPLRRIVARDIEVFSVSRQGVPISFVVNDSLECGHVSSLLSWDCFDLLNAYTENPQVRAQRHRCQPCAEMLSKKRPASVGLGQIARTA